MVLYPFLLGDRTFAPLQSCTSALLTGSPASTLITDCMKIQENCDDFGSIDSKSSVDKEANAAALSASRDTSLVDTTICVHDYHVMMGQSNARLLETSAGTSGIKSTVRLQACIGYSMTKRIRYPVASKTVVRSDHRLGRSFEGLGSPKRSNRSQARDTDFNYGIGFVV